MHYNENSGRNQQQNKHGELQYAITISKYKKVDTLWEGF